MNPVEKFQSNLADKLIIQRIKDAIGLNDCNHFITGAAPLPIELVNYFKSIGMPIMDCYAMSESASLGTTSHPEPGRFRTGSVGKVIEPVNMKIEDLNKYTKDEGEICISGRNICMGYLNLPQLTEEAIDKNGWLHTGDLGYIDKDGFLFLTGRLKELIITAGGENIPPILIEDLVKKQLPCISNCMLVGDNRRYLTMLIALKSEVDISSSEPLDSFSPACLRFMKSIDCEMKTVKEAREEVVTNPGGKLSIAINNGIKRYNENATSTAQKIQKWILLPHDFSVFTGELNTTLKLKRSFVLEKYKEEINQMYEGDDNNDSCF